MKDYSIKKMPKIEWHSTVLYPGEKNAIIRDHHAQQIIRYLITLL